jgi:hypothetical protein
MHVLLLLLALTHAPAHGACSDPVALANFALLAENEGHSYSLQKHTARKARIGARGAAAGGQTAATIAGEMSRARARAYKLARTSSSTHTKLLHVRENVGAARGRAARALLAVAATAERREPFELMLGKKDDPAKLGHESPSPLQSAVRLGQVGCDAHGDGD